MIFLLAFLVRAERLRFLPTADLTFSTPTPYGVRSLDECINIAYSLHAGNGFGSAFWSGPTGPSAHCAPSFPATTAAIFTVFGTGKAGGIARDLVNIAGYGLLFALLPVFAGELGLPAAAGIVSGLGAALYPWYGFSEIMRGRDEWLAALIAVLLLLSALRIARTPEITVTSALLYGAGWGALMYVLPSMVTVLSVQLLIILFVRKRTPRQQLAFSAIALAAFLVVILPWTIRDRTVMGGWMFMRDDVGLELALSNGEGAHATVDGNLAGGWLCHIHPTCNPAAALEVAQIGELEFNRRTGAKAISWIRNHPSRFADLTMRRTAAFWMGSPSSLRSIALSLTLTLLGATGLWLMWRRRLKAESALLAAFWLVYPLPYYVIERVDRYQVPIYPAILLPAGFVLISIYFALRNNMLKGSKKRSTTLSFSGIIPLSVM